MSWDEDGTGSAGLESARGSFVPKRAREGEELVSTGLVATTDSGRGTWRARTNSSPREVMTWAEARRSSERTDGSSWALMERVRLSHWS